MPLSLHCNVAGNAGSPDVLVLHGLFGSSGNWRSIAGKLAGSFRVHSLDLRNHGHSPWSDSMSYLDMAGDVDKYISDNGLVSPAIIGHSMGGKTAMTLLQNFPVEIAQAVILDIAPVAYQHDHDQLLDAMQGLDLNALGSRSEADTALSAKIPESGIRQFLLQNLVRSDGGFGWRINLDAISANHRLIFGYPGGNTVEASVKFIGGEQSEYILPEHYPVLKRHFPNAEITHIKGAGHWLHAERPDAVLGLLLQYLDDK
jgi:pimeloyl-ACP methyl ester carboxylesterase